MTFKELFGNLEIVEHKDVNCLEICGLPGERSAVLAKRAIENVFLTRVDYHGTVLETQLKRKELEGVCWEIINHIVETTIYVFAFPDTLNKLEEVFYLIKDEKGIL